RISFYILPHPFRLVKNFLNLFSQALKAAWDPAADDSCARGCLPPTCNILHGSMLSVKEFFQEQLKKIPAPPYPYRRMPELIFQQPRS
ncbi:hypothetical protein, partial [Selenomonas bovis]|uniref:hypothetical protein n=1 Tax=Selenomonas bovis TaxID=416586 RepID=UPI00197CF1A4